MAWLMVEEHSERGPPSWAHAATATGQAHAQEPGGTPSPTEMVAGRIQVLIFIHSELT